MQLGLSTYSFPWAIGIDAFLPPQRMTAIDLLTYAAAKNIYTVQFGDNIPLHLLPNEELQELEQTKKFLGIQIEVGTKRLDEKNIFQYLTIAQCLQSKYLRVVIDDEDYHPDEREIRKIINSLLPKFKDANIVLAIENHDRFSATALKNIIEDTDPQFVGICLDTANSIGAGEGVNEILPLLAPYTINLHIKDFMIKRVVHKMGFIVEGCAAGDGCLDIPAIVNEVKKYEKCQTATLELWSNPLSTIEDTVTQEHIWVEKSIQYLKSIL